MLCNNLRPCPKTIVSRLESLEKISRAQELRRRGYEIIERRYRTRYGEIDIVARDQDVTVFVEVKARGGNDFGGGAAAVTGWKQRRIAKMAMDFLARHRLHDRPCRFDVVTVDVRQGVPSVEVFTHAFDSDS